MRSIRRHDTTDCGWIKLFHRDGTCKPREIALAPAGGCLDFDGRRLAAQFDYEIHFLPPLLVPIAQVRCTAVSFSATAFAARSTTAW